jgi:hypothetical protein
MELPRSATPNLQQQQQQQQQQMTQEYECKTLLVVTTAHWQLEIRC